MIQTEIAERTDTLAASVAEQAGVIAQGAAEAAEKAPVDWGYILMISAVGFGLVVVMLILLVFVMKGFGAIFSMHREKAPAAKVHMSDEVVVAITTALKLYKSVLHDRESEMLTINRIARTYSPWNSKIYGLTSMPERKK